MFIQSYLVGPLFNAFLRKSNCLIKDKTIFLYNERFHLFLRISVNLTHRNDIKHLRRHCVNTDWIRTEYRKIRTRNNSVLGRFSRTESIAKSLTLMIWFWQVFQWYIKWNFITRPHIAWYAFLHIFFLIVFNFNWFSYVFD